MNRKRRSTPELVARGVVAGVAGGLAASYVMNQFQAGLSKLTQDNAQEKKKESDRSRDLDQDATVKTASTISETVFGHELSRREKEQAGPAVHYGLGATMGGLYTALWRPSRRGCPPGGGCRSARLCGSPPTRWPFRCSACRRSRPSTRRPRTPRRLRRTWSTVCRPTSCVAS